MRIFEKQSADSYSKEIPQNIDKSGFIQLIFLNVKGLSIGLGGIDLWMQIFMFQCTKRSGSISARPFKFWPLYFKISHCGGLSVNF